MKKSFVFICLTIFVFVSFSCAATSFEEKLPSGKIIKIKNISKAFFAKGESALALEYETDMKIDDVDSLRKEAEEIWPLFRVNVDKAKLDNAIIKASGPQKSMGFIFSTSQSYSFILKRKSNGTWDLSSWGRDYDKEGGALAEKFIGMLKNNKAVKAARCMHYPENFTKEELDNDIDGTSTLIRTICDEFGVVGSYRPSEQFVPSLFFTLAGGSVEYWKRHPYFFSLSYDVTYSKKGDGSLFFMFSIINDRVVLSSINFCLPQSAPGTQDVFNALYGRLKEVMTQR